MPTATPEPVDPAVSIIGRSFAAIPLTMSLAYAATELTHAGTSRQLTLTTGMLLALVFAVMVGIAIWSGLNRRRLLERRRAAEVELRATQNRLAQLSNQLPIALFSFRPGHGFEAVSDGIEYLLPVTAQQLLSDPKCLLGAVAGEDRAGLQWLNSGANCPPQLEWLGRSVAQGDGSGPRWLQMRGAADIGPGGERLLTGVVVDVTPLMSTQQALEASREELRRLATYRENEREQEYRRLAREFHDELGQLLTSARMQLQWLEGRVGDDQATRGALAAIESIIGEAYRSVKSIAAELRPAALNLGLPAAIEWQAARVLTPAGLQFTVALAPVAESLPDAAATALFRIVQEAFTNVLRHAGAHSVHVSLRADGGQLILSVADDGRGFDPAAVCAGEHFGLVGMRERVAALHGALDIDSAPGEGARITVHLPLPATESPP
ncbi:MAG: ATP-binding protein [Sulfuritalea sp.]|jgi:signal transduction histidine kinase|nr:ATP-binding protein [Sulfuritalea sp.]